ncbi:MAG: DUF2868 domain-containing protein [Pseudomonadales bacterium]|nr:DUF2868 domain-containing protein [Pseudomonadales bacterium]
MSEPLLATVIDVQRWLREDQQTPYLERLARDREIGRQLEVVPGSRAELQRVLAWWRMVRGGHADEGQQGVRFVSLRRSAVVLLSLLGVVLGLSVGTLGFSYQGDYPVNLITLLGVLVGLPLLLVLITLLLLPGWFPAGTGLGGLNPARWAGAWLDRLADVRLFVASRSIRNSSAFARWQLLVFSQWLAVGYFCGVLVAAWVLIAFTDLAFGWSSTLDIDARGLQTWLAAIAAPWSSWLPRAVPGQELVEASRFFRLETGGVPQARAVQLGQWWPFVLMVILVYGMLPRLLLLLLGSWRLRVACRRLLIEDAEVTALLERLSTPNVSFDRDELELAQDSTDAMSGSATIAVDERTAVLSWNGALTAKGASVWLGGREVAVLALAAWDDGKDRSAKLAESLAHVSRVLIFTKGWEPPLLEFLDLLQLVREAAGERVAITVVPVNVAGDAVEAADRSVWAKALAQRNDARLYVLQDVALPGSPAS